MLFLEAIKKQIWHLRKRVGVELTQKLKLLQANAKLRKNIEVKDDIIVSLLKKIGPSLKRGKSGKNASAVTQDDLKLWFKSVHLEASKKIDDINRSLRS